MKLKYQIILLYCLITLLPFQMVSCKKQQGKQVIKYETKDSFKKVAVELKPVTSNVYEELKRIHTVYPKRAMKGNGLVGVLGGVNLIAHQKGSYDVLLPIPRLVDKQVPIFYSLSVKPESALSSSRLQVREDGNAFLSLVFNADQNTELTIDWSAVVLITPMAIKENDIDPELFTVASPCVQSDSKQITDLATGLCTTNEDDELKQYCLNIRNFIANMENVAPPMSLDALGILKSGINYICTSNANLAAAFMRAQKIPCRMIATIPTNSYRLEMHRIVEYYDGGVWTAFDPSSWSESPLTNTWQNIIMAKSSISDEIASMEPRLCSMLGVPFGQEVEIMKPGLTLHGQDFFWTVAFPLAEFDVTDTIAKLTVACWQEFLQTGIISSKQIDAALATDLDSYSEKISGK